MCPPVLPSSLLRTQLELERFRQRTEAQRAEAQQLMRAPAFPETPGRITPEQYASLTDADRIRRLEMRRQMMAISPPLTLGRSGEILHFRGNPVPMSNLAEVLQNYNQILDDIPWAETTMTMVSSTNIRDTQPISHFGQLRRIRKQFKEYSKEDFRNMSKEPMIKDILTGSHKVSEEEKQDRIKEHVDRIINEEVD